MCIIENLKQNVYNGAYIKWNMDETATFFVSESSSNPENREWKLM